nr:hypothetical protein DM860_003394 [Ipomoea batatas]GMC60533.1 hypothetical protein DM860_003394 [Ipomoea batatas]
MAMAKFSPFTSNTTILAILLLISIAMLATQGVTSPPSPELEDCLKKASDGKCKQEFVTGALKKGSVVKRCCGVLKDVGKDCFIGILKDHQLSTHESVNWDGFWKNSTKILQQCQLSS